MVTIILSFIVLEGCMLAAVGWLLLQEARLSSEFTLRVCCGAIGILIMLIGVIVPTFVILAYRGIIPK